jgi:hypothetical protein
MKNFVFNFDVMIMLGYKWPWKTKKGRKNERRENLVYMRIRTSRHSLCEANHGSESRRQQGEHQFTFHQFTISLFRLEVGDWLS